MESKSLTYDFIKTLYLKNNFPFWTKPFDLNIGGIRTLSKVPNEFNDYIFEAYNDENGLPHVRVNAATTDPGLYWLAHPMNDKGCAILKKGYYHACWEEGMHLGKYKALVQVGPMTVYRDNNRDSNLDIIPGTEDTGLFGINHHRASEWDTLPEVGQYSAGCQVTQAPYNFANELILFDLQIQNGHGSKFSYALFEEADFAV